VNVYVNKDFIMVLTVLMLTVWMDVWKTMVTVITRLEYVHVSPDGEELAVLIRGVFQRIVAEMVDVLLWMVMPYVIVLIHSLALPVLM